MPGCRRGDDTGCLQPLRGDLRPRGDGRGRPGDRDPRQPGRPALPWVHLPQGRLPGRRARRPRPAPAAGTPRRNDRAPTPSGSRSAGTRRSTGSPTAWPVRSTSTAGTRWASTSATRTRTPSAPRPTAWPWSRCCARATGSAPPRSTRSRTSCVAWQLYGHQLLLPIPDIDRTSYFLVFGANPMASNGSLMTVPDFPNRLRALKARGGRMVVVDPRRTETAKVADEHQFVRPGSDAVVVLAMVRTLFEEGLTRPGAVRRTGSTRCATLVEPFTPERGRAGQRHRRRRRTPARARAGRGPWRGGVRPHRRLHHRLRVAGASGASSASTS